MLGYVPNDGYSETAVLTAVPGIHPRVQFSYRPMLVEQVAEYWKAANLVTSAKRKHVDAAYLLKQLKSWDLASAAGETLTMDQATVLKLKPRLFNRLLLIVLGEEAPDQEPDKTGDDQADDAQDVITAAESGRTVSDVREDRLRKNSLAPS